MATLSVDKHCEMLTGRIRDRVNGIMEGFKLFVRMFSAVVGGAVVLHLQYPTISPSYALRADALIFLIFLTGTIIILENARSWYGDRKRLSEIAGNDESGKPIVPPPMIWKAMRLACLLIAVMVVALLGFCWLNPLLAAN